VETLDFNVSEKIAKRPNREEECGKRETDSQLEMLITRKSKADEEGRFRCTECTKLFMTHEFVRKHIHNKHQDLIEKSGRDALDEQCFKNFLADPNKVVSVEPSRKDLEEDRRSMSPDSDYKRRGNLCYCFPCPSYLSSILRKSCF
jgi:serrate RNA effector molecule